MLCVSDHLENQEVSALLQATFQNLSHYFLSKARMSRKMTVQDLFHCVKSSNKWLPQLQIRDWVLSFLFNPLNHDLQWSTRTDHPFTLSNKILFVSVWLLLDVLCVCSHCCCFQSLQLDYLNFKNCLMILILSWQQTEKGLCPER